MRGVEKNLNLTKTTYLAMFLILCIPYLKQCYNICVHTYRNRLNKYIFITVDYSNKD